MRQYAFTLTGKTPLLMHHDNIEWADFMDEWKNKPDNKKLSKPGDDRTPGWRWIGSVYHDDTHLCLPGANFMRSAMEGGAMVPVPGGRSGKTFKAQTQSGMMCVEPNLKFLNSGAQVVWKDIERLKDEPKYTDNKLAAQKLGFDLLAKRAKIGASRHIRVRALFLHWTVSGTLAVWDEQLDDASIALILENAGQYKGLGDWRPGSRTPGPYGTFEASIKASR